MNTGVSVDVEQRRWNDRSQGTVPKQLLFSTTSLHNLLEQSSTSLRKARAGRLGKYSLNRFNPKAPGDGILKKAKALERGRNAKTKSPLSRYDVVPPLQPKLNAYERTQSDDDDSWGEASEGSDYDDYYPATHGYASTQKHNSQTYPLPPMSFALVPVQHPASLGYRTTPPKRPKHKNYLKRKTKTSQQAPTKQDAGVNTETQTDYEDAIRSTGIPALQSDPRYQYIYVNPNPAEVLSRVDKQELVNDAALKFYDDVRFAQSYTEDFIKSQLEDELIPDLLIEVLDETYRKKPSYGQAALPKPYQPFQLQLEPEPRIMPGRDNQARNLIHQADLSKDMADDLVMELVDEELADIVRETCSKHVQKFVTEGNAQEMLEKMTDDIIAETCDSMFDGLLEEISDEALLDRSVTEPVISNLLTDIAVETLQHYDNKLRTAEINELTEVADVKFLDGITLDSLLEQIIKQERVHLDEIPSSNFTLDGMMLDVMLRRLIEIDISKVELLDVKPVKRYHERVVTDVVMDLLLNELCLNLDEDMKDFDEYESGLSEYLLTNKHYDDPSILPRPPQESLRTPQL